MIETKFKIELCLLKNRKLPRPNLLAQKLKKGYVLGKTEPVHICP